MSVASQSTYVHMYCSSGHTVHTMVDECLSPQVEAMDSSHVQGSTTLTVLQYNTI